MNSTTKSIIAVLILLGIFGLSFLYTSSVQAVDYCEGDTLCILGLVEETQDGTLCENSLEKQVCFHESAFLLYDPDYCRFADKKEQCYFDLAVTLGQPEVCTSSVNSSYCFYSFALLINDSSLCPLSREYEDACAKRLIKG